MRPLATIFILLLSLSSCGQRIDRDELDRELNEISGLEVINDTLLAAINDGGNSPSVYLLTHKGEIVKRVLVENARNRDWEDLTRDNNFLYIADIGNNLNKRKDLCIYKIRISDLIKDTLVTASKISFSYNDQKAFPPAKDSMNYDAEAIVYVNDSIWIFTKNKTSPWTGISSVYKIPVNAGTYSLHKSDELFIGDKGWWSDAITSADFYGNRFYLLTYNRLIVMSYKENLIVEEEFDFKKLTQKESVVILNENSYFIADERHKLMGGGFLYKVNR